MADGTARVVNAGAQSSRKPPWILLPELAHTQGGVSSPRRNDDRASRVGSPGNFYASTHDLSRFYCDPGTGMPLRCLIVDDRPSFSDAARELLTDQGVTVVGTATSSAEAIQRIQELRPDVALVDIDLGEESGFDLARRLAANGSAVRVILISTHDEREFKKLIESSPTVGFLAKTELSAENILRLLQ
jgi:CheY-like chemotaxis protein